MPRSLPHSIEPVVNSDPLPRGSARRSGGCAHSKMLDAPFAHGRAKDLSGMDQ